MKTPKFKSNFEKKVWTQAKAHGYTIPYEPCKLNYTVDHVYTPDFCLPNGIMIETKGLLRSSDMKIRWVLKHNPNIDLRFVFMDANKPIRKGAKMRYWQWAEKIGCKWAEGHVPLEWYFEDSIT